MILLITEVTEKSLITEVTEKSLTHLAIGIDSQVTHHVIKTACPCSFVGEVVHAYAYVHAAE